MSPRRRLAAEVVMTIGAILYCTMLQEVVFGFPLDVVNSTLSELAALTQPTSTLSRSIDTASGVLFIIGFFLLLPLVRRGRVAAVGVAGVLVLGIGTVMADLSPLPCAPSLSQHCQQMADHAAERAPEHEGALEIVVHLATSGAASIGSVILALTTLWLLRPSRRSHRDTGDLVAVVSSWCVIAGSVLMGADTILASVRGDEGIAMGLVQRAGVLAVCVMAAVFPRVLIRATGGTAAPSRAPRGTPPHEAPRH